MPNWYLYYRIMYAVGRVSAPRLALQDVLCDLRRKSQREWPDATDQEVQDFFEHLAGNPTLFTEAEARHLTLMEPWAMEEVTNVGSHA